MMNLDSASKDFSFKGKSNYRLSQLSQAGVKINLEKLKYDTLNVFAHTETDTKNTVVACVMEVGKDSYFYYQPATLSSIVAFIDSCETRFYRTLYKNIFERRQ